MILLIIAVANSAGVIFASEPGLDPAPEGADRGITFLLYELAHARLPGLRGDVRLRSGPARQRQHAAGATPEKVLVRRNLWLVVFGFAHAALLYYGKLLRRPQDRRARR
ncbi:hypothetical protein CF166_10460 [Amycolatopsis sp. KNN50.9b]|nr:hypothetical protein CF166_10460 [Amycolatopsis sp. KNN50.9b]